MKKILFIASFPIAGLLLFCLGYAYHKPKTITVTEEVAEEIKVYSLPEGTTLGGLCDNFYGNYANELKEKAKEKAEIYLEGVKAGYLNR